MKKILDIEKLIDYLQALGTRGGFFTAFGFIPALINMFQQITGNQPSVPTWLSNVWLLLSFGYANFRIYKMQSKIECWVKSCSTTLVHIKYPWSEVSNEGLVIRFIGSIYINNSTDRSIKLKMTYLKIESDWIPDLEVKITDTKIVLENRAFGKKDVSSGEFIISPNQFFDELRTTCDFRFQLPETQNIFEYLGSLSKLKIYMVADLGGVKEILCFDCDTELIHNKIEENIISRLKQQSDLVPRQALSDYWYSKRNSMVKR